MFFVSVAGVISTKACGTLQPAETCTAYAKLPDISIPPQFEVGEEYQFDITANVSANSDTSQHQHWVGSGYTWDGNNLISRRTNEEGELIYESIQQPPLNVSESRSGGASTTIPIRIDPWPNY